MESSMALSSNPLVSEIIRNLNAKEVLEQEDFSTLIISSTLDGIYTYDLDHTITLFNPAMERLTGLKKEEVLGRDVFEVFPFFKKYNLERLILDTLAGKPASEKDVPFEVPQTGKRGFVNRRAASLRDESG